MAEPWPAVWTRRPSAVAVLGLLASLAGLGGLLAALPGDRAAALPLLLSAIMLVGCAAVAMADVVIRPLRRTQRGIRIGNHPGHGPGLVVDYSAVQFWAWLAAAVATLAISIFLTGLTALDQSGPLELGTFLLVLACLAVGSYVAQTLRGRRARGYLHLSPHGVCLRETGFEAVATWEDIRSIGPAPGEPTIGVNADNLRVTRTDRLWTRRSRLPQRLLTVPGAEIATDPALALALLTYYADHPEARGELGTAAALRRVRSAAFR